MKHDVLAHVGDGDGGHDDERADHQALAPGLDDQAVRVGGPGHSL